MSSPSAGPTESALRAGVFFRLTLVFVCATGGFATVGCQTPTIVSRKPANLPETLPQPKSFSSRREMYQEEQRLKEQLLENPDDAAGAWLLADVLDRQGLHYEALHLYQRSLELAPNLAPARIGLAKLLRRRGDPKRALREADLAIKADEENAQAHALRGLLLQDLGRNEEALESLRTAWRARPPAIDAGKALADWDLSRGHLEPAADKLRLCLVYEPARADIRLQYAQTLGELGRYVEATRQWETLVNSGEGGARPYFELAKLYALQGERLQALTYLDDAKRLEPDPKKRDAVERLLGSDAALEPPILEYRPLLSESRAGSRRG